MTALFSYPHNMFVTLCDFIILIVTFNAYTM